MKSICDIQIRLISNTCKFIHFVYGIIAHLLQGNVTETAALQAQTTPIYDAFGHK